MSRTYKDRRKRDFRKGQLCPQCGYKKPKAKLEQCDCGCHSKHALLCKTCYWMNF